MGVARVLLMLLMSLGALAQYKPQRKTMFTEFFRHPIICEGSRGMQCSFPTDCRMGETVKVNCSSHTECPNPVSIANVTAQCKFCWQMDRSEMDCLPTRDCETSYSQQIVTYCIVKPHVFCMGQKYFYRNARCSWTTGHRWSTTMWLSVLLGGFGGDRFYLGHWQSAVGKLFSFGGLGVWTILDVILIAVGYLKPADGSHYI